MRRLIAPILAAAFVASCQQAPKAAPPTAEEQRAAAFWKEVAGVHFTEDRSHHGDALPADPLRDRAGAATSLASLRGKPVLVNLWAHWCVPCRAEMPTLNGMAEARAGKLTVVAVNEDAVQPGAKSLGALAIDPHVAEWTDADATLGKRLGAGGLPTTILYGSDGRERWRLVGVLDWTKPQAQALLREAV